jgi:hypothetical protein
MMPYALAENVVTDEERKMLGVPTLEEAKKMMDDVNAELQGRRQK